MTAMTAADYRRLRARLALTQQELADALGISWRQGMRYEHGVTPISKRTEMALRQIAEQRHKKGFQ